MSAAEKPARTTVLVVEDNPGDAALLRDMLEEDGGPDQFAVEHTLRLDQAVRSLERATPDVVLLDLSLPDASGMEAIERLRGVAPRTAIVVLTGLRDPLAATRSLQLGAQEYLVKGLHDRAQLVRTIHHSIERERAREELERTTTELKRANQQLERLSLQDPLTELPNRRGLEQALGRELRWRSRGGQDLLAVLVDLDDFKQINDRRGHAAGDVVLREVGRRLKGALRATDFVARIGGDEFFVLLPQTRPAEGMRVAEKLRVAVAGEPIPLRSGEPAGITASLALVSVSADARTIDDLLAETHFSLYQSKRNGKNRVSPGVLVGGAPTGDGSLGDVLHRLSRGTGFTARTRPLWRPGQGEAGAEIVPAFDVAGFEAPADFYRLAREAGIVVPVDLAAAASCFAAAARLQPGRLAFVNLLPETLGRVAAEELLDGLPKGDLAGRAVVAISEEQVVGDPSYLAGPVTGLRRAGLQLAIRDVGFGRSSLESLILLEPEFVVIDPRYMPGIASDPARVRSMKRLLRVLDSLGAVTVADGVATEDELRTVQDLGVELALGPLWPEGAAR